jgi:hypothetical protein
VAVLAIEVFLVEVERLAVLTGFVGATMSEVKLVYVCTNIDEALR